MVASRRSEGTVRVPLCKCSERCVPRRHCPCALAHGPGNDELGLVKGYWIFWIVLIWTAIILYLCQRIFRIDIDSHYDIYVISALLLSGFLQLGWSAFAALVIHNAFASAPTWIDAVLFIVGLCSSYVACAIESAFYMGSIYRLVNLILAILSYLIFILWPRSARTLYGWFFDLF